MTISLGVNLRLGGPVCGTSAGDGVARAWSWARPIASLQVQRVRDTRNTSVKKACATAATARQQLQRRQLQERRLGESLALEPGLGLHKSRGCWNGVQLQERPDTPQPLQRSRCWTVRSQAV